MSFWMGGGDGGMEGTDSAEEKRCKLNELAGMRGGG